jgi:hypothetical protein
LTLLPGLLLVLLPGRSLPVALGGQHLRAGTEDRLAVLCLLLWLWLLLLGPLGLLLWALGLLGFSGTRPVAC